MITRSSSRRLLVGCLLVGVVLASGPLLGVASSDYAVSIGSETDTPTRTVEIEGSEYTISSVATAQVDGSITVSVSVPEDTSYALDIYNDDEQAVVDTRAGSGPQTESINVSGIEAGTYALTLQVDGSIVDVKPLVVEGVSVTLDIPAEADPDDSLIATVETSSLDGESVPETVEVALWNGDDTVRVDATETDSGTYEAAVDGLAGGDYQVYAAAQGSDTIMGEQNVIGVSEGHTVTISTDDDDDPGDPGGGDPGDGDDGEDNTTIDDSNTSDDDGIGDDGTGDDRTDANETDARPQSPADPETEDDSTDSIPLVGPAALVVPLSLLAGAALHRRLV